MVSSLLPPGLGQLDGTGAMQGPPVPNDMQQVMSLRELEARVTETSRRAAELSRMTPQQYAELNRGRETGLPMRLDQAQEALENETRVALLAEQRARDAYVFAAGRQPTPLNPYQQARLDDLRRQQAEGQQNTIPMRDPTTGEIVQVPSGMSNERFFTYMDQRQARADSNARSDAQLGVSQANLDINRQRLAYNQARDVIMDEYRQNLLNKQNIDQARATAALKIRALNDWYDNARAWQKETITQPWQEMTRQLNQQWDTTARDIANRNTDNRGIYNTQTQAAVTQRGQGLSNARQFGENMAKFAVEALKNFVTPEQLDQIEQRIEREKRRAGIYSRADFSAASSQLPTSGGNRPPRRTAADMGYTSMDPADIALGAMSKYAQWERETYPHVGPRQPQVPDQILTPPAPNMQMPPDYVGPPPDMTGLVPDDILAEATRYGQYTRGNYQPQTPDPSASVSGMSRDEQWRMGMVDPMDDPWWAGPRDREDY